MPKKKEDLSALEGLSVNDLAAQRKEIKNLLATLEDDYRKAAVTEKSYQEVKKKNQEKLAKITEILYNMGITEDEPASTPAPAATAQHAASPPPTGSP
ncbi:MAG: hypothetical protein HY520_04360, partial [Candidatus Aenigmarchaeota archaeon]|nr:hypothetical protein [Candidatus Aenigmarchaeota archaeon]